MTTASHLQLVTERPAAPAPVPVPRARAGRIALVTVALAVVLALLAAQPWPLPERTGGAVSDVPRSLLNFLVLAAGACLWAAGRATRPRETFRSPAAARVWWTTVVLAAAVSVAAALSMASYAGEGERPGGLLVRWMVPFAPALVAGVLARTDGRAARVRAALGTGVVTLPLFALGWALVAASGAFPLVLADVVVLTLLVGVAPFALAVAFVAADRRRRP